MKKITLLAGAASGFVLGSRAGRAPYEKLETKVKELLQREDVQDALDQAKNTATEQMSTVASKVGEKVPGIQPSADADTLTDTETVAAKVD